MTHIQLLHTQTSLHSRLRRDDGLYIHKINELASIADGGLDTEIPAIDFVTLSCLQKSLMSVARFLESCSGDTATHQLVSSKLIDPLKRVISSLGGKNQTEETANLIQSIREFTK